MPQAQSADGVIHEFPEGVDPAVMDRAMKQYVASKTQGGGSIDVSPPSTEEKGGSTLSALWDGLLHGAGNIVHGAARIGSRMTEPGAEGPVGGLAESVDRSSLQRQKAFEHQPSVRAHPTATAIGEVGGEMATLAPLGVGSRLAPLWERMLQGAATGGISGAIGGAANAPAGEKFGPAVAKGAGAGMAVGGALGAPRIGGSPEAGRRLADFEAQGVTPNIPAIGQGRNTGLAAQFGRLAPFSPVERGIKRNLNEAAGAAERGAAQFGQAGVGGDAAAAAEAGGGVARNALRRFAADKSEADTNYGKFWQVMHGANPAPTTNTRAVLGKIMGKYPNAPELEGLFTSPKLARLREGLEPKTVTTPAKTSGMLDPYGRPIVTSPASTVTRGGTLSIPEMKELRSQVGKMLENATPFGPDSITRAEVKQLYGALSGDLMAAARQRGPAAVQSLVRANTAYNQRMKIIDQLSALTSQDSPDAVFRALNSAATQGGSNANLLTIARKTMTGDEWKDVGSAIIRRLGNPTPGAARPANAPANFSVNSFATNWRRLSDTAKDSFFGPNREGSSRAGLEQLYRVTNDLSNVSRLANTSHSGEYVALGSALTAAFTAMADGSLHTAGAVGASVAGTWGISKALMSPAFTRWVYKLPETISGATTPEAARILAVDSLKAAFRGGAPGAVGEKIGKDRSTLRFDQSDDDDARRIPAGERSTPPAGLH